MQHKPLSVNDGIAHDRGLMKAHLVEAVHDVKYRGDTPCHPRTTHPTFTLIVVRLASASQGGPEGSDTIQKADLILTLSSMPQEEGPQRSGWGWGRPRCNGTAPANRYLHTATPVGDKVYIFGGSRCAEDEFLLFF